MPPALVASGYELFRISLRSILERSGRYSRVAEASDVGEFLREATGLRDPALAIVDPGSLGLQPADAISLSQRLIPDCPLVLLTDRALAAQPEAGGAAVTTLRRDARLAEVERAIMSLSERDGEEDAAMAAADGAPAREPPLERSRSCASTLSPRQEQILEMMAEGLANKEIAYRLGIAEGTVKAHIHAIFRALGVSNRTQAVLRFSGRWLKSGAA